MKKFLIIFLVIVVLLVGGVAIFIATFDINSYKERIEQAASDALGRPVLLKGTMSLTKTLTPTLIIRDVEIENPASFDAPNFAVIPEVRVNMDLHSLFDRVIDIKSVSADKGNVFFEINKAGKNNWAFAPAKPVRETTPQHKLSEKATGKLQFKLQDVVLKNVTVSYKDFTQNKAHEVTFSQIGLQQLTNFDLAFIYNQEQFFVKGSVKDLLQAIEGSQTFNFSFSVAAYQANATIFGNIYDVKKLNNLTLNVHVAGSNLNKTAAYFMDASQVPAVPFSFDTQLKLKGVDLYGDFTAALLKDGLKVKLSAELPDIHKMDVTGSVSIVGSDAAFLQTYGVKPFTLDTKFTYTDNKQLSLANINMMANETDLSGALAVAFAKKPVVVGNLSSQYFNVNDIVTQKPQTTVSAQANTKKTKAFSSDPIDVSFLDMADGQVSVLVENMNVSGAIRDYPRLSLVVDLRNSTLTTNIMEGSTIGQGRMVGRVILQKNPTNELSSSAVLVAQDVQVNQFPSFRQHFKDGVVQLNADLTTQGKSVADLAGNLDGTFFVLLNDTELLSPLLKILPSSVLSTAGRVVPYGQPDDTVLSVRCAVANIKAKDGVINLAQKVAMETNRLNMVFGGNVNLKKESYSLELVPMAPKGKTTEIANIASQYILLDGTFTGGMPSVKLNTMAAATTAAAAMLSSGLSIPAAQVLKKATDDVNPCKTAMDGTTLKTVDSFLGRVTEKPLPAPAPQVETETKKAGPLTQGEQFGMELLGAISDLLNQGKIPLVSGSAE